MESENSGSEFDFLDSDFSDVESVFGHWYLHMCDFDNYLDDGSVVKTFIICENEAQYFQVRGWIWAHVDRGLRIEVPYRDLGGLRLTSGVAFLMAMESGRNAEIEQ